MAMNHKPSRVVLTRLLLGLLVAGSGLLSLPTAAGRRQAETAPRPNTQNAKVEPRAVTGGLRQTVEGWAAAAEHAEWLGYSVPAADGERQVCCGENWGNGNCGPCRLEGGEHGSNVHLGGEKVELEAAARMIVLIRAEARKIGQVRMVSGGCTIDAGGLRVIWLGEVTAAESVSYLERLVDGNELKGHGGRGLSQGALAAIALHGDPSADQALQTFTSRDKPEGLRKQAAFWAGEARGAAGVALLKRMAKDDPSAEVRAQVTFALSVSREADAVDEMIRMAKDDASGHVRSQALFWLGQKGGPKAVTAISGAIENDPDSEVRKKAVFALSQLPKDEGVPMLIEVAQKNPSPEVRSQALFWLAQKAGKKAAGAISGAIENDPDTEVKKKAVFALSQLPKDEGVPKLIEVAETNRNPEVRKQAMFWLGQSNDPRAVNFFEKVLSK
jgi:HEAT repeat protein